MLVRNRDYLHELITWHKTNDPEYPYESIHETQKLIIRLNDFPDDYLYTLLVDAEPVTSFDDWPDIWIRETDDIYSDFMTIVSLTNDGGPMVDEIGVALTALVKYLEPESRRDQEFRHLIAQVKEVWRGRGVAKNWDEIFFRQAMKHDWPNWAIVELNSLNIAVGATNEALTRYLIWEIYLPFLDELGVVFVVSQKGILLEIDASSEAALFLEKTRFTIEGIRNRSPFRSYRSILGAANQGFMDLELYFRAEGATTLAAIVDEGRRTILRPFGS